MNSREFKNVWNYTKSGSLSDFGQLSSSIYHSLINIEENYVDFFSANSFTGIREYINLFNEAYEKIIDICYRVIPSSRYGKIWYDFERYEFNNNLKDDLFVRNGDKCKINDQYLSQLMPYIQKICDIEENCSLVVNKIWRNELTPIEEYKPDGKYKLLAKVLSDWREDIDTPLKREYMRSRVGSSCSLITNNKVEKFDEGNSDYGYIYDIKDGFLAAHKEDAYMEEFISGFCPVKTYSGKEMKDIYCVYNDGINKVYTKKPVSKITTPKQLMNKYDFGYNEVIVDAQKTKPCAVFYLSYGQKFICKDYFKALNESEKTSLPLIEIPYLKYNYLSGEAKKEYDELPTKEKLLRTLSYKNNTATNSFNLSIMNLLFHPDLEYYLIYDEEITNIATLMIDKNPASMVETKQIIADYYSQGHAAKANLECYNGYIQRAIKKGSNQHKDSTIEIDR